MTDSNTAPDAAMSAAIDNMVAAGSSFSNMRVEPPHPSMKYDSATGITEQTGDSVNAPIPDTGRIVDVEIAAIQANMDALTARFNAETDYGKREVLGAQLARAQEAAVYDVSRLAKLQVQREETARVNEAAANQKLALAAFANGNQERAAALKAALLDEEAKLAAQTFMAARAHEIRGRW
jgi:hypothetical protein